MKAKELDINIKYNMLKPVRFNKVKNGNHYWYFQCDCGNVKSISKSKVATGEQKSCGCQQHPKKHGYSKTRVHNIWKRMRQRCNNPNSSNAETHYNRGIKICKSWDKFENFLKDMGQPPTNKHTIERINNDGNYEPENCKWATRREQAYNRRSTRFITFKGKTKPLKKWCIDLGFNFRTIQTRLNQYGWSIEKALTTPTRKINKKMI
jgi:hypothetical protein